MFVLENFAQGGVERVSLQLLKGLQASGQHQLLVLCQQAQGEMLDAYAELAPITPFASSFRTFRQAVIGFAPDVILFTKGGLSRFGLVAPGRCKQVAVQHVPIKLPDSPWLKNLLRQYAARLLYRRLDKVICVSDGIKTDLIQHKIAPAAQLQRIYNPVLDSSIQALSLAQPVEQQNYFVCVGRLHYQKGYDNLLQIVTEVKQAGHAIQVLILGDGPARQQLSADISALGLTDNVVLLGNVANPYPYLKAAKALLLPSRWEGLPTVLVEAAALNTQTVAFDCPHGPAELSQQGRCGFLIAPGDNAAFAKAIMAIINGQQHKMADTTAFEVDAATANYLALFERLVQR